MSHPKENSFSWKYSYKTFQYFQNFIFFFSWKYLEKQRENFEGLVLSSWWAAANYSETTFFFFLNLLHLATFYPALGQRPDAWELWRGLDSQGIASSEEKDNITISIGSSGKRQRTPFTRSHFPPFTFHPPPAFHLLLLAFLTQPHSGNWKPRLPWSSNMSCSFVHLVNGLLYRWTQGTDGLHSWKTYHTLTAIWSTTRIWFLRQKILIVIWLDD